MRNTCAEYITVICTNLLDTIKNGQIKLQKNYYVYCTLLKIVFLLALITISYQMALQTGRKKHGNSTITSFKQLYELK